MSLNMQYDATGLLETRNFESCELEAYWDTNGKVWTIGWGHTGPEVTQGLAWTQEQADAAQENDIRAAAATVNTQVTVPLTQPEFDALVDFTYNVGCGAFASSTLLNLLNQGDYQGAAEQINRWDHSGGQVLAGLLRRREAETAEFEGSAS